MNTAVPERATNRKPGTNKVLIQGGPRTAPDSHSRVTDQHGRYTDS